MPSLVINAPDYQLPRKGTKSFKDTFETGVGRAYALNWTILQQVIPDGAVQPDWRVVLLWKDKKCRAEGKLIRIVPAEEDAVPLFTKNGIRRYDVHAEKFAMVPYRPEKLNRNGVAVIGQC
jgi:hypothetical protein